MFIVPSMICRDTRNPELAALAGVSRHLEHCISISTSASFECQYAMVFIFLPVLSLPAGCAVRLGISGDDASVAAIVCAAMIAPIFGGSAAVSDAAPRRILSPANLALTEISLRRGFFCFPL